MARHITKHTKIPKVPKFFMIQFLTMFTVRMTWIYRSSTKVDHSGMRGYTRKATDCMNLKTRSYSGVQIRWQWLFWAENQGNHQNFDTSFLTYKCWLIFMAMKRKKIQNGRLKKGSFSISANSQYFFSKISWIGPWVSRIDWS